MYNFFKLIKISNMFAQENKATTNNYITITAKVINCQQNLKNFIGKVCHDLPQFIIFKGELLKYNAL